jgi:ribosomal protein S18 acetylase RimI-like enzyme
MTPEVVRADPEDWAAVREIRLRALLDAPDAFASRLDDERDRPEALWRQRLSSSDASTFLAVDEGDPVGLVTVYRDPDDRTCAHLVSLWVSPDHRRSGVATSLTETVLDWARLADVQTVDLWVTENNQGARHLYERCGFSDSGERQPLPSNPHLREMAMHRTIPRVIVPSSEARP